MKAPIEDHNINQTNIEEELRATTQLLEIERRQLAEAQALANIGSWRGDLGSSTLRWSDENYRIFGIPRRAGPLSFDDFFACVHPDDRQRVQAAFEAAVLQRRPYEFDHRIILPDGTVKWVQERCEFAYGEDGRAHTAHGTTQDITARKNAELALHHSQQLLRIATRVGRIGGWDVDLANLTVSWSDEVCAIHGVPPGYHPTVEEAINFYAPEYRDKIQACVDESIAQGTPFDLELQIVNVAGQRVWVRAIGEVEIGPAGTVTGMRGAFQDISERMTTIVALRESDERFRLMAQATSDVVWDWNIKDGTCWWSDGLRAKFGHASGPVTDHPFRLENIHPDDRHRVATGLQEAVTAGRPWSDEYRFRRADGTYAQITDRALVQVGADGQASRMVGAIVDVTEQRTLAARLAQAERVSRLGQIAAAMAHEFNNVLMGIQPFAEVIRRATLDVEKAQSAVVRIIESVKRGKDITADILRFTRTSDPVLRPVDVGAWLRELCSRAQAASHGDLRIELAIPAAPVEILGDVTQLGYALTNLLNNAREASPDDGRVIVGVSGPTASSQVEITVRDFGRGMEPAVLERIFEPLFTTKKHGTGLGLAVVHQVVTKHGGTIAAESRSGEGTAFHIVLPLHRSEVVEVRDVPPVMRQLPRKILIVDDDAPVADGIAMLLASEGLETTSVLAGTAALAAVEEADPEVVMLDIGLPDISGVDVFKKIHERWPELKVILMTGHFNRSDLGAILDLPQVRFLQKPFSAADLIATLKCVAAAGGSATSQ